MPIALASASLVALIAGLLGDGVVDIVAWVGLALPLVAIVRALCIAKPIERSGRR